MYIISIVLAIISLCFAIIGFSLMIIKDDWVLLLAFGLISLIFGVITFAIFPSKRTINYTLEIQKHGINEEWENEKNNEKKTSFIRYQDITDVLIGIYEERFVGYKQRDFYVVKAMMVIKYQSKYFFKIIENTEELNIWKDQLKDKTPSIRYTDNNIKRAFFEREYMEIDFSNIHGDSEDLVSEYIGNESYMRCHEDWMPDELFDQLEKKKQEFIQPKTKRAAKYTFGVLFIYNILFAALAFPYAVKDGVIEFSDLIYYGYVIANFMIPTALVFWRRFTKWYLPFIFLIATLTGNYIGVGFAFMEYDSIIEFNILNLFLWFIGLIIVKSFMFLFRFTERAKVP